MKLGGNARIAGTDAVLMPLRFVRLTRRHRVYLTFRQATGGPATGFGLINWVEFSGPGV